MITLKVNQKPVTFETSIFPDKTSQVWHLNSDLFNAHYQITFHWEGNEAEIFHLCQLVDLIRYNADDAYIHVTIPYLPFARQDKPVSQNCTFALTTFANLLNSKKLDIVSSFDVHSNMAGKLIRNFHNTTPEMFHYTTHVKYKPDVVFYPDAGAAKRYSKANNEIILYGEKVRNQQTGTIEGYRVCNSGLFDLQDKRVLILDDLCDGGATFITAAKALKELGVKNIALCVSHGLFSKGLEEMKAAGIIEFFTTNSLITNKEGYNIL